MMVTGASAGPQEGSSSGLTWGFARAASSGCQMFQAARPAPAKAMNASSRRRGSRLLCIACLQLMSALRLSRLLRVYQTPAHPPLSSKGKSRGSYDKSTLIPLFKGEARPRFSLPRKSGLTRPCAVFLRHLDVYGLSPCLRLARVILKKTRLTEVLPEAVKLHCLLEPPCSQTFGSMPIDSMSAVNCPCSVETSIEPAVPLLQLNDEARKPTGGA